MTLSTGTRLGPYEIVALLGAGGMGEVYRARDTRLNRDVAVKVMPEIFAQDSERMARFEREAQVLASLNHPNIAQLYGLEERALVMELVEGPTLAERIAGGPLPIEEALPIAKQIAEALEAAHEKGIIHRDLKPANVKVRPDGSVKVLDFGLAKALADDAIAGDSAHSPTLSIAATRAGVILGTAAYMSPEQAKGKPVDRRADIWAFGIVLLETLTGRKMYSGETAAETLAFVMTKDPSLEALPGETPVAVRRLLRRCLDKDPKRRLQAIGEARIAIEETLSGAAPEPAPPPAPTAAPVPQTQRPVAWMAFAGAATLLALALAVVAAVHFRETPAKTPVVRFLVAPPEKTSRRPWDFPVVSPNGEYLALVAGSDTVSSLWVRPLHSLTAQSLPGTEGASMPFWSPDSRFIGFWAQGRLKKVEISGGPPQTLCDAPFMTGGTWGPDGTILFAPFPSGPLRRVAAAGGEAKLVTTLDASRQETLHSRPAFLPDGRQFLYQVAATQPEHNGVYIGSLDSKDTRRLLSGTGNAVYAAAATGQGYLLFARGDPLMAQPFDPKKLGFSGEAFPIAERVSSAGTVGSAFSVSDTGVLAYQSSGGLNTTQLVWYDRNGKRSEPVGPPAEYSNPALAPDERKLAVGRTDPAAKTRDLWVFDLVRGTASRLTFDPADDLNPTWSPDGSRIAFTSERKGPRNLYQKLASGTGEEELLFESPERKSVEDWSPDGRFLLYNVGGAPKTRDDLWALPLTGDRKPVTLVRTPFNDSQGQLSPDGRWLAYRSAESGKYEVYVQAFPPSGGKWQISTAGGEEPRWRRDGKELFYVAEDKLMAVRVKAVGSNFEAGIPGMLLEAPLVKAGHRNRYLVASNGQRFLINATLEQTAASPFTVVLNWLAAVKK
jgi:Tol biopolymer transport system component/predicted Ser/Thr protein kinase